ncbi:MAG: class I SAM-dependent methyltransferase [archaeon]
MTPYTQHHLLAQEFQDPRLQETFQAETDLLLTKILQTKAHSIMDFGCGDGRTIRNLVPEIAVERVGQEKRTSIYGVDFDRDLIERAHKLTTHSSGVYDLIYFRDIVKKGVDQRQDSWDMAYSTHNTLGGLRVFMPNDRQAFVNEMARIVRPGGLVTNMTWKQDDSTTEFLEQYYSAIGFDIEYMTPGTTLVRSTINGERFEFARIHPRGMGYTYKAAGLVNPATEEVGPLWVAVTAQVQEVTGE